jgi:hypothetical protein
MSANNGLKVCTFNAKCDDLDYKCCIKETCHDNKWGNAKTLPDSFVAAMIAVTILPSKADIYNIQNVHNKRIVEHLVKEISRVKSITDKVDHNKCRTNISEIIDIAYKLNSFSDLCTDATALRDALTNCKICNLDYVNVHTNLYVNACTDANGCNDEIKPCGTLLIDVLKYTNISEYDAYYGGTCLTLVKKSLRLCPETREIQYVDSLVLFFEYYDKKFINVNVNLGSLVNSFEELGYKKDKVDDLIYFLRKYKDCGAVLMSGAFGDLDYDVEQLLYKSDGKLPEIALKLMAGGINESPVPADFPCDLNDPLYECMEFLFKTCNAEVVPYAWLLQYLRLKACKKCGLYKLVNNDSSKCEKSCKPDNGRDWKFNNGRDWKPNNGRDWKPNNGRDWKFNNDGDWKSNNDRDWKSNNERDYKPDNGRECKSGYWRDCKPDCKPDCKSEHWRDRKPDNWHGPGSRDSGTDGPDHDNRKNNSDDFYTQLGGHNRQQLRDAVRRSDGGWDKKNNSRPGYQFGARDCEKPACVPAQKNCCEPKCEKICENKCKIQYPKCYCDDTKCEIKCKKQHDCECGNSKHRVNVDVCKDLCKKKACCNSCTKGGHCDGDDDSKDARDATDARDVNLCPKKCDGFKYCDTLTTLKRELCLYNTLDKVCDVDNRYTEFLDHFNKCLDCKFPRGIFQAWAMREKYEEPRKTSRIIDNNSELLALDHFLVSDCLKNNITCASLSDLCIEKCGKSVKDLIVRRKFNVHNKTPYVVTGTPQCPVSSPYLFEYSGSLVRSFFTHRVYCITFEFPFMKKGCEVDCGESLHGLGLTSLWSAICNFGSRFVNIEVFEKFGLDKHPYFLDYFWKYYQRKTCPTSNCAGAVVKHALLEKYGACENTNLLYIQKRHNITEDEFYKHLLCIFSNIDNRDRFIVTIAFMECLFKVDKLKCMFNENDVKLFCDTDLITLLFKFLTKCFGDRFKLANYLDSQSVINKFSCVTGLKLPAGDCLAEIFSNVDYVDLCALIDILSVCLKDNCLLMEVLSRHATKALAFGPDTLCGSGSNSQLLINLQFGCRDTLERCVDMIVRTLPHDCACDRVRYAIHDLLCGADAKEIVAELIEVCHGKNVILLLFALIGLSIPKLLVGV